MKKNHKDISDKVMTEIHNKRISMRPKIYFVFGSVIVGVGLAALLVFSVFLFNLVFFRLRVHGPFGYLWFGKFGWRPFISTFPFMPLLLGIITLVIGIELLKRYDLSYKKSFVGLVIIISTFVLTLGYVLTVINLDKSIGQFPPLAPFYQDRFLTEYFVVGEVIGVGEDEIELETPHGDRIKVIIRKNTLLPFGREFKLGEKVRVVGKRENGSFVAKGISKGGLHFERKLPPRW
jgi:hypothetical protein